MSLAPLPPRSAALSIQLPQHLDAVRSKLVHLIDALSTLLSQLHYLSLSTPEPTSSNPGILPYSDLLSRYNLLLSHFSSLSSLLSSVGDPREQERRKEDRGRDEKRERWEGSLVVPAVQVEEQQDWIVGMLLRTKQTPQVEAHLASLLASLPPAFALPSSSSSALAAHAALTSQASSLITTLKESLDGEDWDWRGRVEVDDHEDEEDEDAEESRKRREEKEREEREKEMRERRKWSLQEVANFQRTGRAPNHVVQEREKRRKAEEKRGGVEAIVVD